MEVPILDVSNPSSPRETSYINCSNVMWGAWDVAVNAGLAFVADWSAGLQVIDVTNPTQPHEVGSYDTPGYANGVAVADSYAYVADGDFGVRVIDVSDATRPREVGSYDTPGSAQGIVVADRYAYVADATAGLRVLDVSNPSSPREVAFFETPGRAERVAVAGGLVYVTDGAGFYKDGSYTYVSNESGGVDILRLTGNTPPAAVHVGGFHVDVSASVGGTSFGLGRPIDLRGLTIQRDQPLPSGALSYTGTVADIGYQSTLVLGVTSLSPLVVELQRYQITLDTGQSADLSAIDAVTLGTPGTTDFSKGAIYTVPGIGDVTFTFKGQAQLDSP